MDIYNSLKNNALELQCPDCGALLRFGPEDLKEKRVLACACGNEIGLEEESRNSTKLQKAAQDLEKALRKLGLE